MHGYNTRRMSRLATARSRQLTVNGGDSTAPGTASNGPRRGEDQNQLSVVPSTKKHSEAISSATANVALCKTEET